MRPSRFLQFLFLIILLISCHSNESQKELHLSILNIQQWIDPHFELKNSKIRAEIERQSQLGGRMYADAFTKTYYAGKGNFLWISRHGIDSRSDTLLTCLRQVGSHGLTPRAFHVPDIEHDLSLLHTKEFGDEDVNRVMGRLEYRLTQAYLRYTAGLRYGFVRPHKLLNNLLPDDGNIKPAYRILFDIDCDIPQDSFYHHAMNLARHSDSLAVFLHEVEPCDSLYAQMQADYLAARQAGDTARTRLAYINMERARWRYPRPCGGKYIWVNLAGFELTAVDEARDTSFTMLVCGGNQGHKTPLLQSAIQKVETDPYWIIPMTIVRKEIMPRHVGDTAYFKRNHYRIIDKHSNEEVKPADMTGSMLTSGRYTIRQDNGAANSLGRLIFRFPNQFAVYLHDTNNHGAFRRQNRAVSHGCVRVERPLDLALFLMQEPDSILEDKIRMAIDLKPRTQWGKRLLSENPNAKKLGSYTYPVSTPVFIDYYTLYPDLKGHLVPHPDVYHYDEEIDKILRNL
jgi:murein L,D-transpeptidase YcbB/YkuD